MSVPRIEYRLWRRIVADRGLSFLRFGDYGVIYPTQTEADVPRAPPSRVRITTKDRHLLYKGGPKEIRAISRQAVVDGALNDAEPSWGAKAVRDCASGRGGLGNAPIWVARDTNMHVENAVAAIARILGIDTRNIPMTADGPWLQDSLGLSDNA